MSTFIWSRTSGLRAPTSALPAVAHRALRTAPAMADRQVGRAPWRARGVPDVPGTRQGLLLLGPGRWRRWTWVRL
jgi:hypothetical protein